MGVTEAKILYSSSTLNTGSGYVYKVGKRWCVFGSPPELIANQVV